MKGDPKLGGKSVAAWGSNLPARNYSICGWRDFVQIKENIRGRDVFLVQPTCTPVNENLMELLIMVDAARRASAKRITAVLPYYGYARRTGKTGPVFRSAPGLWRI